MAQKTLIKVIKDAVPLLAILIMAVILRLCFITGMVHWDDFRYAQLAYDLSQGIFSTEKWEGTARIVFYGPVGLLYKFFGVSDITSLVLPFLYSILGIILIYFIARILGGEQAGLITAIIWSVLPLNVSTATALLPDSMLAFFVLSSVLFFLIGIRHQGQVISFIFYSLAVVILIVSVFIKPSGLTVMFLYILYFLWKGLSGKQINRWLIPGFIVLFALVVYVYTIYEGYTSVSSSLSPPTITTIAETSTDWFYNLIVKSEFAYLTPLFIIAIAISLSSAEANTVIPILWLCTSFLYFELGSMGLTQYEPVPATWQSRQILYVLSPFVVLTGLYLGRVKYGTFLKWFIIGLSFGISLTALVVSLSINSTDKDSIPILLISISQISAAMVIFGGLASSLFIISNAQKYKNIFIALLLTNVCIGSLYPINILVTEISDSWTVGYRKVIREVDKYSDYPVLVQNPMVGLRLNYLTGFQYGFTSKIFDKQQDSNRIRLNQPDRKNIKSAFVIVDKMLVNDKTWGEPPAYISAPPQNWLLVDSFDELELYVYSPEIDRNLEQQLQNDIQNQPSQEKLSKLMKIADEAGDYCLKVKAWNEMVVITPDAASWYDPSADLFQCYQFNPEIAGTNLIHNGDFSNGTEGWYHDESWQAEISVLKDEDSKSFLQIRLDNGDPKAVRQEINLKPDTWYVYDEIIKTNTPVTALFIESDPSFFSEEGKVYTEWTSVLLIFKTPHWEGEAKPFNLYPVLLSEPGSVWVKNIRLSEINLIMP